MAWTSRVDAAQNACLEAEATAKRLGHDLGGWTEVGGSWYALCLGCRERLVVRPRQFGALRIKGAPVVIECRPIRTVVPFGYIVVMG